MQARILGPLGRGEFAAVILWPSIFAAVGLWGANTAIGRIAAIEANSEGITRGALISSLVTGFITSGICCLSLPFLLPMSERHLLGLARCFLVFIILNHLTLSMIAIDQGRGDFKTYNITRSILNPVYLLIISILWLTGIREVGWFIFATILANVFTAGFRLIGLLRSVSLRGVVYPPLKILKAAVPFGIADSLNPVYQLADKSLILWLLGTYQLGIYAVAQSASSVVGILAGSISIISFTISARAGGNKGLSEIGMLFRLSLLIWITLGIALALSMPLLLPLIFGHEFGLAVLPATLLIPSMAIQGQSAILEQALRGEGRAFPGIAGKSIGVLVMFMTSLLTSNFLGIFSVVLGFFIANLISFLVIAKVFVSANRMGGLSTLIPGREEFRVLMSLYYEYCKRFRASTGY